MIEVPVIDTERLHLCALEERHFDAYAAMLADADNTRWVGSGEPLDRMNAWRSLAMLVGHWQLRGFGMWAVEHRDDGSFLGRVGLMRPEGWPDVELGWMLCREHRHHGYATEASLATLDFAWRQLHLPRVISLVRSGNDVSDQVARRLGGEHVDDIDFLGAATSVFAYYPPQRRLSAAR